MTDRAFNFNIVHTPESIYRTCKLKLNYVKVTKLFENCTLGDIESWLASMASEARILTREQREKKTDGVLFSNITLLECYQWLIIESRKPY